jgi:hypothetical protein
MKIPSKQPDKEIPLPNPDDILRKMLSTKPKPHKLAESKPKKPKKQ